MYFLRLFVLCLVASTVSLRADALGPASKRTALVISEIMYHPADRADQKNLEYIEIYNSEAVDKNIGGFRIDGDVNFTFPAGTVIRGLGFVVVSAAPSELMAQTGLPSVLGPFDAGGVLPNGSGRIELWSKSGGLLLEVDYSDDYPWPSAADGAGHSLVLARPTFGQNELKAWASSAFIGGSPGALEPAIPNTALNGILLNEILAHTDDPVVDYIELYNPTNAMVNLSGCVLTDDPTTNKFVIGDVNIGARGFASFTQSELGFALGADGETIYLKNPQGTRIIDCIRFGGQENNVSWGRFPNGAPEWYRQTSKTPGQSNSGMRQSPVVINELMYSPISEDDDDQFVELHNWSANPVNVGGWGLEGGVAFTIPANTMLAPNGYLVIARNAARLAGRYTNLTSTNLLGDFSGRLAGSGERVVLTMPDTIVATNNNVRVTNVIHIAVDEVTYETGGRWAELADGGGSSLELIDPRANHRLASNWAESDESRKAPWTIVEQTGTLDNGTGSPDQLQMHLQGAGECLVDDVEVIPAGGANLIANSTFESGAAGWTAEGTQELSGGDVFEGYNSARSYRIRATDRGDTGANRIRTPLTTALSPGGVATIRAKVRWLRGRPEMLLRLRGNYLEAIGTMTIPTNLGTPGERNSRAAANVGPAIYDVSHSPVLPAANQAFVVTARVDDPDGIATVELLHRLDTAASPTTTAMRDDGTNGDAIANDGIFSARIGGFASGSMVAFYVRATDGVSAQLRFPSDAPARECLVRIGETQPAGSIGTYRLWMTTATRNLWSSRGPLHNGPLDVTFVYNNERVIYNLKAMYAGSPYISPGYSGPTSGLCGYTGEFPKDDLFLGVNDFVLDWPGRDPSAVGEAMTYVIADLVGLPNSHRRFIHLHVNGVNEQSRGSIYEDVQQPGGDMIKEWSPGDDDGNFFKIERWFEFNDSRGLIADPQPQLRDYRTTGGAKKLAAYRWMFLPRAVEGSVNDFDDVFAWADAANAAAPEPYTSQMEALTDMERVMGIFAMERIISNFDSWGHLIGKNMYAYKPRKGKWYTFMFDNDWIFDASSGFGYGPTSALFTPCNDPTVARMYNHPPFRRAYFRTVQKAVEALAPGIIGPIMDQKYAALVASGVTRSAGQALVDPTPVKTWLATRRQFLSEQLAPLSASVQITSNGGVDFTSNTNLVTLTGTAPIEVFTMKVNGIEYPVTWTADTQWSIQAPLSAAVTIFEIGGFTREGVLVGSDSIRVTFTGTIEQPLGKVVFNEIMYNAPTTGASFVELRSLATSTTFDLSNWRIEGVGFTFAPGTFLPPGGFLVVTKNRAAFAATYGANVKLAGEFQGQLQNDSETLWLIKPGATPAQDTVIDQVTYSDQAPWPQAADGSGGSLQLIDATQDNTRAFNWAALTNAPGTATPTLLVALDQLWKYDQSGVNLGVEWRGPGYNDAAWPSGRALLYVESSDLPGPKNTALTIGRPTYYFRSKFNFAGDPSKVDLNVSTVVDDGVVIYLNGKELYRAGMEDPYDYTTNSTRLVDNAVLEGPFLRESTWLKTGENVISAEVHQNNSGSSDIVFGMTLETAPRTAPIATPGAANSVARALPQFPKVWINEIQPVNLTGPVDEFGGRDPWVELYNADSSPVSLNGWRLSDSATNLTRWSFPGDAVIQPGQRLIVWLDAQAGTSQLHANFRASAGSGTVALVFPFEGQDTVLDYINYSSVPNDRSVGRFPDGDNAGVQLFLTPTPGAANNNAAPALRLYINEWMASNSIIRDPTDNDFDDWFEVYNPNDSEIDLTGYMVTDNLADPRERYSIPGGFSIPARGFLLVWADGEQLTNRNHLHVNFNLARGGESIGLYSPGGSLIDSITFTAQTNNISQGRATDGAAEFAYFTAPTPGASNSGEMDAPVITGIAQEPGGIVIRFDSIPGVTYRLEYKADLEAAQWTEVSRFSAPGTSTEARDAISGLRRFYRLVVE